MARFKLKFRMGGSRSTSQEHDPDPQVNEALLNHHQEQQHGTSTSTLDSADCNSLASLGANSERRSLLPNNSSSRSNNFRLGYLNPTTANDIASNKTDSTTVPSTPPPSYEHVLEELQNTHLSSQFGHSPQREISNSTSHGSGDSLHRQSRRSSANSVQTNHLEQLYEIETCNDPNCEENIAYNERQRMQREQDLNLNGGATNDNEHSNSNSIANEIRKSSIDSSEYLLSTTMTAPASAENLLNDCTDSECQQYDGDDYGNGAYGGSSGDGQGSPNGNAVSNCNGNTNNDFCDPLMNHGNYYNNETHSRNHLGMVSSSSHDDIYSNSRLHQQQQQQQAMLRHVRTLTPEIISNKSSKEIYKDLAKQWGITCKMSDGCRCMECQSHYFDCEFDDNEHQKSDGGLGAGTPMFISEVMHGSACHIL